VPVAAIAVIRRTGVTEYWIGLTASLWFDASELHHLAPFPGFVGDQPAKVGGREHEHIATQVGKPRLDLGIGKPALISLLSLSTMSAGVFFGSPRPVRKLNS
jgi:hypothetical protein